MSKATQRPYKVESPIKFNGDRYHPDDNDANIIKLTDKEAKSLLAIKAISNPEADSVADDSGDGKAAPSDGDARITAIVEAIGKLDKDNEDHWTNGGPPDAKALSKILGLNFFTQVKADERDKAWAEFNNQQDSTTKGEQ